MAQDPTIASSSANAVGSGNATAASSAPWFQQNPSASGLTTTSQDAALNQAVNGVANKLSSQGTSLVTAINALATAINAKPSA